MATSSALNVVEFVNPLNVTSTVFSPRTMLLAEITWVTLPPTNVGVAITTSLTLIDISPEASAIVTVTELSSPNEISEFSTLKIISTGKLSRTSLLDPVPRSTAPLPFLPLLIK